MVKVVYVRHSETFFNVEKKVQKKSGIEKVKLNGFFQTLRDFQFVDSDITENGIKTTETAKQENHELLKKIKYVLVSPLVRALHTADILFNSNQMHSDLKIIVHPGLRTKLTTIYNVPFKWIEQKNKFKNFDFAEMDTRYAKYGFGWFADELYSEEHRTNLVKITEKNRELPLRQQVTHVLEYMEKIYPKCFYAEERREKFLKMVDFHIWMENFIKENGIKDEELCVVGHSSILKMLVAKEFDEKSLPIKTKKLANTEFVSFEISESALSKEGKLKN